MTASTSDQDDQNEEIEALAAIYGDDFAHYESERRLQVGELVNFVRVVHMAWKR